MVVRKRYVHGEHLVVCDITGMRRYRSQCRFMWDGNLVQKPSWNQREAQDFVHGLIDDQSVVDSRPDILDTVGETTLSAAAAKDAKSVTLVTVAGIADGDSIGITLDDTTIHWTFSDGTPVGTTVTLPVDATLPSAAASGNDVLLPSISSREYISPSDVSASDL